MSDVRVMFASDEEQKSLLRLDSFMLCSRKVIVRGFPCSGNVFPKMDGAEDACIAGIVDLETGTSGDVR